MSHKRPWKRGQDDGTPLVEKETPEMMLDAREDEQDAREADEARQTPGERVALESYIATRESDEGVDLSVQKDWSKCQSGLRLIGFDGKAKDYHCSQPVGHRGSHGARSQALLLSGAACEFKLLWEEATGV